MSLFYNASSVKTVIFPATFKAENLASDLHAAFPYTGMTIYYSGTEAEFIKLQEKFALATTSPGNKGITQATYNYISPCVAFYGGEHDELTVVNRFEGTEYLTPFKSYEGCDRCKQVSEKSTVCEAIYLYKGFSTDGEGLFYDIKINTEAMQIYTEKTGKTLKYGIAVSQLVEGGKLIDENEEVLNAHVLSIKLTGTEYSSLQVKIFNIADSLKTMQIHCCAYIIDGNGVNYVYDVENEDGERVPNLFDVANKVSYSDVDE